MTEARITGMTVTKYRRNHFRHQSSRNTFPEPVNPLCSAFWEHKRKWFPASRQSTGI